MKSIYKSLYLVLVGLASAPLCYAADLLDNLPDWADIVTNCATTATGVVTSFSPAMYLAIGIAVGIFGVRFVIGIFRSM